MSGKELCPHCGGELIGRSNGNGNVYLECRGNCGYVEGVYRKADPFPTIVTTFTDENGHKRKRYDTRIKSGKRFFDEEAA